MNSVANMGEERQNFWQIIHDVRHWDGFEIIIDVD